MKKVCTVRYKLKDNPAYRRYRFIPAVYTLFAILYFLNALGRRDSVGVVLAIVWILFSLYQWLYYWFIPVKIEIYDEGIRTNLGFFRWDEFREVESKDGWVTLKAKKWTRISIPRKAVESCPHAFLELL